MNAMKPLLLLPLVLGWTQSVWGGDSSRAIYRIETVAGSSLIGDGGPATAAQIGSIQGLAVDRSGNLYLSDTDHHRVRKINAAGIISTLAGTGTAGFSGDGGPAASAQLNLPYGLAADSSGALYVADLGNNRVRRIGPDGVIATFAGAGVQGSAGDGGPAAGAQLLAPRNVAVDAAGNLFVSEFGGHRVRKITPDGRISTVAGTGVAGFRGDGGPAIYAQLAFPAGLAVDQAGALYIADSQNQRVRKILAGGTMSTVLGGDPATSLLSPVGVAVDAVGSIAVADTGPTVRAYSAAGSWAVVAGQGEIGFAGDGGPAVSAWLTSARDVAAGAGGILYIADGVRIRRVDASRNIQTVAGDAYLHSIGDGGPAAAAQLLQPSAVLLDFAGNLYIADAGTERVRKVVPSGTIVTVAGSGIQSLGPELAPATASPLDSPAGLALDVEGLLLFAETGNHRVRQVGSGGLVRTVLGTGQPGIGPELTPALQAPLHSPRGLCSSGSALYVADTLNHRVLRAPWGALVETEAGSGTPGNAGDGGAARVAQLNQPSACVLDAAGNLFIADTGNHAIRKVSPDGKIGTVAGVGQPGFAGDGGPAISASLNSPAGVAVDGNGSIFITDSGNHCIRQVTPDGVMHTIAGRGSPGFAGDGGAALDAQLNAPAGLVIDGAGDLYFADTGNNRVRRLLPQSIMADPVTLPPPPLSAVNAASLQAGPAAPGEIVSIFGSGIGPGAGVAGVFDSGGLLANQLAGVQVKFDGLAAPLFYVQSAQINVQVPYTVAGSQSTHVEVIYQGVSVNTMDVPVAAAAPALFPAVLNPDGSLNSASAPAPPGSILTFFATGEGLTNGPNVAGQPAAAPYPRPTQPVTLSIAGVQAEILYSGSAPGLIGVLQVNARIPGSLPPGDGMEVKLTVGAAESPPLTIWTTP
jgi:uncharacterized protein (TIGR03437 family)